MIEGFEEKFGTFFTGCQRIVNFGHTNSIAGQQFPLTYPWIKFDPIRANTRYIRIWKCDNWNARAREYNGMGADKWTDKRAYLFVDTTNGNVLRCKTWRAPELKFPCGNIFDVHNGLSQVNSTGAFRV